MPPARGRGRGRGRGKSIPATEPPGAVPETAVSTPEHMHIDPSPNSSPATIPTETPAPTPARSTPLRPDGPSNGGPSNGGSSIAAPPATARTKLGAKEAAAPSKFKPKNVRRGADEREKLARLDMERKENMAKLAAREEAMASRGRGRGGARGRGDAMGRRVEPRSTATGTFGIAPAEMEKQKVQAMSAGRGGFDAEDYNMMEQGGRGVGQGGPGGGTGGGGGGGSGGGYGGGVGGFGNRENPIQVDYPADLDEGNVGPLIDIEKIGAISDDEDVIITGSRTVNRKGGLRPVRLPRHEHQERNALLDETEDPVKKEEPSDDDDVVMTDSVPRTDPPVALDAPMFIKPDPDLEPAFGESIGLESSPKFRNPNDIEPSSSANETDIPATPSRKVKIKPPTSPELNKKTKEVPVHKEPPVFACEEDKAEYARHMEDVAILAAELGGLHPRVDGDVDMDAQDDKREGRLYLFQFPPILPKLYNPVTTQKPPLPGALKVKEEPEAEVRNGTGKSKAKPVDLSADEIKPEAEEIIVAVEKTDKKTRIKRDRVVDEQGYVGQMIVRESGKVEFSWGGTSMVVSRGVDASFLTTGVVMDANMRGARPGVPAHEIEGRAIGMGRIMGKFVVTPDFEKMFGSDFS